MLTLHLVEGFHCIPSASLRIDEDIVREAYLSDEHLFSPVQGIEKETRTIEYLIGEKDTKFRKSVGWKL